ncbi:MAG TPA: zf-HC2 domain-containing protein, partial [Patescibacteria group bacterium]|nr:zf-HC2 domain-containing protein [Patescibacteria group bacterium]
MTKRNGPGCPDEMTTAAYLDRTLPTARREAIEAHFAACDSCRAGVALLATMGTDESRAPAAFVAR